MPKRSKGSAAKRKLDRESLLAHFKATLTRIHLEDAVKMMRVRPQHAMPFSHKQIYIRRNNNNKQCQADERYCRECHNPKCPCREFETLNREELKTLDATVLKQRESFIEYLRKGYKDVFQPKHLLGAREAGEEDMKVMVNVLADLVDEEVENGGEDWKCIRGFHALIPYLDLCQNSKIVTFIIYATQLPDYNPLAEMLVPMFKYWLSDDKFGIHFASFIGYVLVHYMENGAAFHALLSSNLSCAMEYISPLGNCFHGSEKVREFLLLFHAKVLQDNHDTAENAAVVNNIKLVKGKEAYLKVAQAYVEDKVDVDMAGTYVDFLEQTGAPVNPDMYAVRLERPGCCRQSPMPAFILKAREKFDQRLRKLLARERRDPLWEVKRQMFMSKVETFQHRFANFPFDKVKEEEANNKQKTQKNGNQSAYQSSEPKKDQFTGSKPVPDVDLAKTTSPKPSKSGKESKKGDQYLPTSSVTNPGPGFTSSGQRNPFQNNGKGQCGGDTASNLENKKPKKKRNTSMDRDSKPNFFYNTAPSEKKNSKYPSQIKSKSKNSDQSETKDPTDTEKLKIPGDLSKEKSKNKGAKKSETSAGIEGEFMCELNQDDKINKLSHKLKTSSVDKGVDFTNVPPSQSLSKNTNATSRSDRPTEHSQLNGITKDGNAKQYVQEKLWPNFDKKGDATSKHCGCTPGGNCGSCASESNLFDHGGGGDAGRNAVGDCGVAEHLRQMCIEETTGGVTSESGKKTSKSKTKIRTCAYCAKASREGERYGKCSECRKVAYCSKDCQRTHWKLAHRYRCTPVHVNEC
ncbi:uncharacterized protein LOC112041234 isoform X1 [Lingula anatina]|uniref:Uncharacterized protein LOC112041234 isoform X1 n=1 Tax=Lingula anatina TaxID=7574 RepID=A0A2R2MM32_LINAN|nr:uncharacterized protein LOC112041234 isoform X1 [Lingula anatina]|eukprot:XP_023931293.1 uncharacterized protein LOC112041234 isoform X1 [Lingula anatina]